MFRLIALLALVGFACSLAIHVRTYASASGGGERFGLLLHLGILALALPTVLLGNLRSPDFHLGRPWSLLLAALLLNAPHGCWAPRASAPAR